jgi:hypothetical protein
VQPSARGRGTRLLYWFRTPPGVRVGRAPIDETAVRLLEQHNPDVQFDWTRILKAPPAEGPVRRDRDSRDRDQRGRRENRREQRPRSAAQDQGSAQPAGSAGARPARTADSEAEHDDQPEQELSRSPAAEHWPEAPASEEPAADYGDDPSAAEYLGPEAATAGEVAADHADYATRLPSDPMAAEAMDAFGVEAAETLGAEAASAAKAAEHLEPTVFEGRPEDVGSASYQRLGAEGLVRLRARYAEVMARIAERPLEEDAREELKQQAERLNPDAWVTSDEVTAALEQYETVFEGLRGVVGRHPRRRRRGRR